MKKNNVFFLEKMATMRLKHANAIGNGFNYNVLMFL